jgi:hypothetical protein
MIFLETVSMRHTSHGCRYCTITAYASSDAAENAAASRRITKQHKPYAKDQLTKSPTQHSTCRPRPPRVWKKAAHGRSTKSSRATLLPQLWILLSMTPWSSTLGVLTIRLPSEASSSGSKQCRQHRLLLFIMVVQWPLAPEPFASQRHMNIGRSQQLK